MTPTIHKLALILTLATLGLASTASAQTGVSGDRVSLPDGPGSLEGVGDNVSINPNMGMMGYSVNFELPEGHPGMTPELSLAYSASGGASVVGIGWSMDMPAIERMTSRGLPEYTDADLFAVDGSAELVKVSDGEPAIYRARFEGGFARYKWFERGAGDGGYWVVESPDGTIAFYGADAQGAEVPEARLEGQAGTARYHLVEAVDVWGHRIRYGYTRPGDVPLLSRIDYVFEGDTPRFGAELIYAPRPDHINDATFGFETVLAHRLTEVRVRSGGVQLQRHALTYQGLDEAGGISRLARVERFGLRGERFPSAFTFDYSRSLGGVCDGQGCQRPFLVSMARNLGVNFRSGNVTLIDINGDALPDLLDTTSDGAHRFFINQLGPGDAHGFSPPRTSQVGSAATHRLSAGRVQVLDVDGDGFADLLNTGTGQVLQNLGGGDWAGLVDLFDQPGDLPDLEGELDDGLDPQNGDLTSVRFMDFDMDRRVDVIKSVGVGDLNQTTIYRNEGAGGFRLAPGVEPLGIGFDSDHLDLADINGDGLLDPVRLLPGSLRVRINLGRGRWTEERVISDLPFDENDIDQGLVELEDLNNDGLADLVITRSSQLAYALNNNGTAFDPPVTLGDAQFQEGFPRRQDTTTVLYADMNASGSTDVVWIEADGSVTFLELFPVQPHLLSRIENGLGMVTEVTYSTTAQHAAQATEAGQPWGRTLNFATTVVTRAETWDTLSNIRQVTEYRYRDGFYDGAEKQFRGFGQVTTHKHGDETLEDTLTELRFDLGLDDPWRAGLELETRTSSPDAPIQTVRTTYEDCPVAEVPQGLPIPVRHVCPTVIETVGHEKAPEDQWATTRVEQTHDGYGNITATHNHGIVSIGGQGCAPCQRDASIFGQPCGPQCLGDEEHQELEMIPPGAQTTDGRWMLGVVSRVRAYGRQGGQVAEQTLFYDGEPFVGLPEGRLTHGALVRTVHKVGGGRPDVTLRRYRLNEHGRVVEAILPNGDPEVTDDHREVARYDEDGLNPISVEVFLRDENGQPYTLRQTHQHDPLWNLPLGESAWQTLRGGNALTPLNVSTVAYDQFGRPTDFFRPEDGEEAPSEVLRYELGDPVTRLVVQRRTRPGGPFELETVQCLDGLGRTYQERTLVAPGQWIVSGFQRFNTDNTPRQIYSRYEADSGQCDLTPPQGVPYSQQRYDAMGRLVERTWISAQGQPEATWRNEYRPTATLAWDAEDTNPDSPHFDTPVRYEHNGVGKRWRSTEARHQAPDLVHEFTYDDLGRFRGWIDPEGHQKVQTFNLMGQLTRVEDPDRGTTSYEYDRAGNLARQIDARGAVEAFQYDARARITASWDEADPEGTRHTFAYDFPRQCDPARCTNAADRLVEATFPDGQGGRGARLYGFNPNEQATFQALTLRGATFEMTWAYDQADRVTERTFPDGQRVAVEYDGASRAIAYDGLVDGLSFTPEGLLHTMVLANGVTETHGYDALLRPSSRRLEGPGGDIVSVEMAYDRQNNLLSVTDRLPRPGQPSLDAAMTYDDLYRMTEAHLDRGREGFDELLTYQHDDLHNLTAKSSSRQSASAAHVGPLTYGGPRPHAVTAAGGLTFEYDEAGRMTRRGDMTFARDARGRLTAVEREGRAVARHLYDTGHQRVLKESDDATVWTMSDDFEIRDGVSTVRLLVGDNEVARRHSLTLATEVLSDIAPLQGDASAPDGQIDAGDAMVAIARREGWRAVNSSQPPSDPDALLRASVNRLLFDEGERTFLHHAPLHHAVASTDEAGAVIERAAYHPYGTLRTAQAASPHGYSGQESDPATGLIDFGARHLDPWLGRWLDPDPAFAFHQDESIAHPSEELAAYTFVRNNPMSLRDRDGLFAIESINFVAMGIGAAIGGTAGLWRGVVNSYETQILGGQGRPTGHLILGTLTGALSGAFSGGRSLGGILVQSAIEHAALRGWAARGLNHQQVITLSRATGLAAGTLVNVGGVIALSALGLTGVGLPVSLGVIAGVAAVKALHIYAKHRNFYGRAHLAYHNWRANHRGTEGAARKRNRAHARLQRNIREGANTGPLKGFRGYDSAGSHATAEARKFKLRHSTVKGGTRINKGPKPTK